MKTILMNNRIFSMLMLAFITLSLVSCDKEDDVVKPTFKQELTGTWDISSYKLEGSEYIGVLVEKASISFDAYTGPKGQFQQEVTFFGEEAATLEGAYAADETKREVTMDYEGDYITAKVTITNGKQMLFEAGNFLVIVATKR